MKKLYRKIDEQGFFIEDVFFDIDVDGELPSNYIESEVPAGFNTPKWNGEEWVEGDEDKKLEDFKTSQKETVKNIFAKFAYQLKKIAIDKDGDKEYIDSQLEAYETMYKNALDGLYSEEKNNEIITANRLGRAKVARALEVMNELRALLISKVNNGEDITKYLDFLNGVELTKDNITDEVIDDFLEAFNNL